MGSAASAASHATLLTEQTFVAVRSEDERAVSSKMDDAATLDLCRRAYLKRRASETTSKQRPALPEPGPQAAPEH